MIFSMRLILRGKPYSTNSLYRRHGHTIYMSKEGRDLKQSYQWQVKSQCKQPISKEPLKIAIDLFFPDKKKRDIDNYHKILLDSMSDIVWKDDSQITEMKVVKTIDNLDPRIEVEVFT